MDWIREEINILNTSKHLMALWMSYFVLDDGWSTDEFDDEVSHCICQSNIYRRPVTSWKINGFLMQFSLIYLKNEQRMWRYEHHPTHLITFCVSRRRRKMYCGYARLCVCVSVCLSAAACPHYCTDAYVTSADSGRGCPLVVYFWADLQ